MDGRDEAARWINLALKLLVNRDLVGTKTFAIRAKEADPTTGYADEILAVVDTLMAAQNQINGRYDWYGILQVERLCRDVEMIAGGYRKLALLLNPQRNGLPFAEEAFGLVAEAWSVLSNPMRKSLYDNELSWLDLSGSGFRVQQHQFLPIQSQPPPPPPPHVVTTLRVQPQEQTPQVVTPLRMQPQVVTPLRAQAQLRQQQQQQHEVVQQQPQRKVQYLPQFQSLSQPQVQFQHMPQPPVQSQPPPLPQVQSQPPPQPQVQSQPPPQPQVQSQPPLQKESHPQPQQQVQRHKQTQERQQEPAPVQLDRPMWNVPERTQVDAEVEVEVEEEVVTDPVEADNAEVSAFWTACPYCYHLFEYLKEYEDCTLRCQNKSCRRAFYGNAIAPPPDSKSDKKASFCSWGVFPIGATPVFLNSGKDGSQKHGWVPFSPMFTCPVEPGKGVAPVAPNVRSSVQRKPKAVIVDDEDFVLMELSDSSDDSDADWGSGGKRKKRGRPPKVKSHGSKSAKRGGVEKPMSGTSHAGDRARGRYGNTEVNFANEGVVNASAAKVTNGKSGTNGSSNLSKKAPGKNPKDLGKLDLNVEFNNEVEETISTKNSSSGAETLNGAGTSSAAATSTGVGTSNGEEENIEAEGVGFFEGLDEFLDSLPILSVVGDDKVKAA